MNNDFEYVCKTYKVPACIGRRVIVNGKAGVIAADRGHYIGVNFDNDKAGVIRNCHPEWEVTYQGIGKVRKLTRSQQRYKDYLAVGECFENFKHYLIYTSANKEQS